MAASPETAWTARLLLAMGFGALAGWGVLVVAAGRRSHRLSWRRPRLLATQALFTGSCGLASAALWGGWFARWMLLPVGLSYLAMLPHPCSFEAVNRIRWLRRLRNLLFLLFALACTGLALGAIPLAWIGL